MKRILVATILGVLLLVAGVFITTKPPAMKMVATVRADEGAPCSLATVAGSAGFTISGTLILPTGPVPAAGVGRYTIGRDGSFSATETRSIGGGVEQETIKGMVTVNPDCTGTITAQVFAAPTGALVRTSGLAIVFDDNTKELRAIQTSLVLPDNTSVPNVITAEARKISHE